MLNYIEIYDKDICRELNIIAKKQQHNSIINIKDLDDVECSINYSSINNTLEIQIDEQEYYLDVIYNNEEEILYWHLDNNISIGDFIYKILPAVSQNV